MAYFLTAFAATDGNEGGWQNDPSDGGNNSSGLGTWRGMAIAKNPSWKGWPIIRAAIAAMPPQPKYSTGAYKGWVKELNATLTANTALCDMLAAYYKANFWDVNRLGDLASQSLANYVYDYGVNGGTGTAAMVLQKVLGVMPDGNIGPVTIAAANKWDGAKLTEAFREARRAKYRSLVAARPEYAKYLTTWLDRC